MDSVTSPPGYAGRWVAKEDFGPSVDKVHVMTSDASQDRMAAFRSLRRIHNWGLGLVALGVFLTFVMTNMTATELPFTLPDWLINAFLSVDCLFVLLVVAVLPRTPAQRAVLADLNTPVVLFLVALFVTIPLANIFLDEPLLLPWSPALALLLLCPLGALEIGRQAYWRLSGSDPRTEGERLKELYGFVAAGAGLSAFFLVAIWLRVIIQVGISNIRADILVVMGLTAVAILEALYVDVTVHWMERPLQKGHALWLMAISSFVCLATGYQLALISDWQEFHREVLLIVLLHGHLLALGTFFIRGTSSRAVMLTYVALITPGVAYLMFLVGSDTPYVARAARWLNENATVISQGFGWLLGAMAGSALFSALVWRFGAGYRRQKKRLNINTATLADVTRVPGISFELGQRILAHRPYETYADIMERAEGVGMKRLDFLREAFDVTNE
jgi:hypothetical protein